MCKNLLQRAWALKRYPEFIDTAAKDGGQSVFLEAVCKDVRSLSHTLR